jgi:hypothetical protein
MKLTDAERAKLAAAIKHFEGLQKRYTKQHNGTACEHVKMALIGLDRLTQEPEVVQSEWINIEPCTNDAVEYADFIAYLARTQMHIEWWECKNCGSIDMGAPTRKPCHCRGCGALMRNGDFDKSKPNDGERKEGT